MKLNRFETVSGTYIEKISGQSRIGYSLNDSMDFYDIIEHSKKGIITVLSFPFTTTRMVRFTSHFPNREMYHTDILFIPIIVFGFCKEIIIKGFTRSTDTFRVKFRK